MSPALPMKNSPPKNSKNVRIQEYKNIKAVASAPASLEESSQANEVTRKVETDRTIIGRSVQEQFADLEKQTTSASACADTLDKQLEEMSASACADKIKKEDTSAFQDECKSVDCASVSVKIATKTPSASGNAAEQKQSTQEPASGFDPDYHYAPMPNGAWKKWPRKRLTETKSATQRLSETPAEKACNSYVVTADWGSL
jgi:hypothetical protein